MPATHAQETCTRNLHVCPSILHKFLAHNRTQLYSSTETVQHMTRIMERDRLHSFLVQEAVMNLRQIFSRKL